MKAKTNGLLIFLCVLLLALVVCVSQVEAQDEYGAADFSRRDCFTRDKLVGCWNPLSAKPMGDAFQGQGDFEGTWDTSHATCSACPEGWVCSCSGDSDISHETTKIFKGDSSVKFVVDGSSSAVYLRKTILLKANTSYQVSFRAYGDVDGNEDVKIIIQDTGGAIYYNFNMDLWNALAGIEMIFANIGQTWDRKVAYVKCDGLDRTVNLSLYRSAASQTFYIDDIQIRELRAQGAMTDTQITVAPAVTSDPFWADYSYLGVGTEFDGVDDGLSRSDDDTFDPAENEGSFSVGFRALSTEAVNCGVLGKDQGGANRNYSFYITNTNTLFFYWWDVTSTIDSTSIANAITQDTMTSAVVSYRNMGDPFSIVNLYADSLTAVTITNGEAPVKDSGLDFEIGHTTSGYFPGTIEEVCYWNKTLSAIEANKYINPYFPGNSTTGDGFWVDTCSQAASHSVCEWSGCRDGTPNKCEAEGTGAMAVFGQYEELIVDNSGETFTGDDSDPTYTDWVVTETPGDGTASLTAYREDVFHGDASVRMKLTGTTSSIQFDSACMAIDRTKDNYTELSAKALSGESDLFTYGISFSDASCTNDYSVEFINQIGNVSSSWDQYGKLIAANSMAATATHIKYRIKSYQSASDILVDAVSLKEASYHTPFVENPSGTVSTTYNARDYRLHNPLSDYIGETQKYAYEDGFCASMWIFTDWDGTDDSNRYFTFVPVTAGSNNLWRFRFPGSGLIRIDHYDSAGGEIRKYTSINGTSWQIGTWKYIEACSSNTGTVVGHHYETGNLTWYAWDSSTGAGTGIQDGQSDEIHVGGASGVVLTDGYLQHLVISPYSATWPNKKFNNGIPPKLPY